MSKLLSDNGLEAHLYEIIGLKDAEGNFNMGHVVGLINQQKRLFAESEALKAKLAVASNAKICENKHGALYVVFETENRDVSKNELVAIYHEELSILNKIDTTLKLESED